jgi:glycosyltransferase involved in cell wall biosynthesis
MAESLQWANAIPRRPAISVIVPTFNSAGVICEALASVTAQRYDNLEILVIDDGSTDATAEVVRWACPGARVFQQANAGAAAARNKGLREANGELIAFLDADDVWFQGKLEAQVAALKARPDAGFVFTNWIVAAEPPDWNSPAAQAMRASWPPPGEIEQELSGWLYTALLFDFVINTSTLLLRRELVRETGFFDETLRRGQDYDYWLRMSRIAQGVKLKRPFALYRQHPGNAIRKPQPRNYAYEILSGAVRRWGTSGPDGSTIPPARLRAALSRSCRDFAYLHAHCGSASLSLKYAARAIMEDLSDPGNLWFSTKIAARAALRTLTDRLRRRPPSPG